MATYTCPRCNGWGKEKQTVISWSTGKTEDKEVSCSKCGGTGKIDGYGNSKSF